MIENVYDSIFLTYDKILQRLEIANVKTKNGKRITHKDLVKAISIMEKKHKNCRWKSKKIKSKKYYILIEGYYWLINVYFQNKKAQIDADIDFFLLRIKQYENLLSINSKNLFYEDICQDELEKYFYRTRRTIENAIKKMLIYNKDYRYKENNKYIISKEGIEWLCKNCFKQKYLEILENYKMELTEKYIQAGFPYDDFFGKN